MRKANEEILIPMGLATTPGNSVSMAMYWYCWTTWRMVRNSSSKLWPQTSRMPHSSLLGILAPPFPMELIPPEIWKDKESINCLSLLKMRKVFFVYLFKFYGQNVATFWPAAFALPLVLFLTICSCLKQQQEETNAIRTTSNHTKKLQRLWKNITFTTGRN